MKARSIAQERSRAWYIISTAFTIALISLLFYVLNYLTPMYGDDYSYVNSFATEQRITSVWQIPESQFAHYFSMNGRVVTHALAQVFLLLGDDLFNLLNVAGFLFLLFLIHFHAYGTWKVTQIWKLALAAMLLFLCAPAFGQSFLWITGSSNYLYGPIIVLCFLIPYRVQVQAGVTAYSRGKEILLALAALAAGLIAGWTNENTSVALVAMILGFLVVYRINHVRYHAWHFAGLAGSAIGCYMLITGPGIQNRWNTFGGFDSWKACVYRGIRYTRTMVDYLDLIILLFLLLLAAYLIKKGVRMTKVKGKEKILLFQDSLPTLVYLLGFFGSVYSMVVAPWFSDRVWSGCIILALVTLGNLDALVDASKVKKGVTLVVFLCILVLFCGRFHDAYLELDDLHTQFEEREETILAAVAAGESTVSVPRLCGITGYSCITQEGDLEADSDSWRNITMARYYGIDEIQCNNAE